MTTIQEAKIGDYVKFGSYPQSAKGIVRPIEWLVLSKEENKMLLISRYGLEARYFIKAKCFDSNSNDWKNSEIRKWLNGEFYNKAFDENEKTNINPFDGDNLFLLSKEEVEKYFVNAKERKCKATKHAVKNCALIDNGCNYGWLPQTLVNDNNGCSSWWLRSPRPNISNIVYNVDSVGSIVCSRVDDSYNFVRPALWIKL